MSRIFLLASFVLLCAGNVALCQTANFSASVLSGCAPLTVSFTDLSTGFDPATTSWDWDLDNNGNTSTIKNPGAIYKDPGIHTIRLTISDASHSAMHTLAIQVYAKPDVDFMFDNPSGCTPLKVKFTDKSTPGSGQLTQWLWVFGDGGNSTERNPEYTYTAPGNRSITLKVTNQFGCFEDTTKGNVINVIGPLSQFTASNTAVCQIPAKIDFTNASTGGAPLTYTWDFGDGATSTDQHPSHTYTTSGTYNVLLKTRDANGCESTSQQRTIFAGNAGGLDFDVSALRICPNGLINFTEQTAGFVINRNWEFGGGQISSDPTPSVRFKDPGIYPVTLTALLYGNDCDSKVTKNIEVIAIPEPKFVYDADCNYKVTFTNTTAGAARVDWYIQNALVTPTPGQTFNRQFQLAGGYPIRLIAYNVLNCKDTLDKMIIVPSKPSASFTPGAEQDCSSNSLSGCAPFVLQLTNTSSASTTTFTSFWEFGDGTTSTTKNPAHTYPKGNYNLKLTVTDADGCTGTYTRKVTVSDVTPVANFTIDKTKVCTGSDVLFTDQSTNATFWCWDFGDGQTSNSKVVQHRYKEPGVYTVRLIVKNAGCPSTKEIINAVEVMDPLVDFDITINCSNPYEISLNNQSINYDSIFWDFGDGNKSENNETSHQYTTTGNYIVSLQCFNETSGCRTTRSIPVGIRELKADFVIDNPKPCKGERVHFTDKSEFAVGWDWDFRNDSTSGKQHPSTVFRTSGSYNVLLTVVDDNGCEARKSIAVNVVNIEGDFDINAVSYCDSLEVQFIDQSTGNPPIVGWSWDFGNGNTSIAQNPAQTFYSLGPYPIKLTVKNTDGKDCSFIKQNGIVFTNPTPNFRPSRQGACIDETIYFNNLSTDAKTFSWDLGEGTVTTNARPQTTYRATGIYPVTITATDDVGCTLSKTLSINITKPVANFTAIDTVGECPPLTSTFLDTSTGNPQLWNWDFGDGVTSVIQSPLYTYLRPGVFDVALTVTDANGCTDTTVMKKLITVGGPNGTFVSGVPGISCTAQTVPFLYETINAVTLTWDYGDGNLAILDSVAESIHTYIAPGSHTVSLLLKDNKGCEVTAIGDVKIIINDTTRIAFDYWPKCIFEGEPFELQATVEEEDTEVDWQWVIGGQPVGMDPELSVSIDTAGGQRIVLRAINEYGCLSEISSIIPIHGNPTRIPNVFTPNDIDTLNAHFIIEGVEKSKWNVEVFNRWGEAVYKKNDYANDWDGGNLPSGVYYYYLSNFFCDDRTYKGIISIRR